MTSIRLAQIRALAATERPTPSLEQCLQMRDALAELLAHFDQREREHAKTIDLFDNVIFED